MRHFFSIRSKYQVCVGYGATTAVSSTAPSWTTSAPVGELRTFKRHVRCVGRQRASLAQTAFSIFLSTVCCVCVNARSGHVSSTMDGVGGGSGDNLPEGEGPEVLQEQESKCENRD